MKDDAIDNDVWDFYMKAAPAPETGERFYVQSFPVRNLNAVHEKFTSIQAVLKLAEECLNGVTLAPFQEPCSCDREVGWECAPCGVNRWANDVLEKIKDMKAK